MDTIKDIVKILGIQRKREKYAEYKDELLEIRSHLNRLASDEYVAQYIKIYNSLKTITDSEELLMRDMKLKTLERLHQSVADYVNLRKYYIFLDSFSNYQRTIQVELRERLAALDLPDIYIYQGLVKPSKKTLYRHIIVPSKEIETEEPVGTIILPTKKRESNRQINQFYARTSYRYLDALTRDYSFDLEGKDLGPVLIKK
jgi:hypothetical protein